MTYDPTKDYPFLPADQIVAVDLRLPLGVWNLVVAYAQTMRERRAQNGITPEQCVRARVASRPEDVIAFMTDVGICDLERSRFPQPSQSPSKAVVEVLPSPLLVWWTSSLAAETVADLYGDRHGAPGWPEYLRRQFQSRYGRSGRSRLWVDESFGAAPVSIPEHRFADPPKITPLLAGVVDSQIRKTTIGPWIEREGMAGIVIHMHDRHHVDGLPGIVTDLDLVVR